MNKALTDDEIARLCMRRYRTDDSFTETIQQDRKDALDAYLTKPYGNEIDGQSKFITSDVRDTIEWMLPGMVEMFVGADNPVTFKAKDAEDVEAAKVESEYIRDQYNNKNNGFLNTYTWLKDGLLSKNGVVKVYWDEKVDEVKETYRNKSFLEYAQLASDKQIEIKAVTIMLGDDEYGIEDLEEFGGLDGFIQLYPQALFDIDAVRSEDNSQARIEPLPPENFIYDNDHPSLDLQDISFCGEINVLPKSDLIVDGYSRDLVDSIPIGSIHDFDDEKVNRHASDGSYNQDFFEDEGTQEVTVYEFYIRVDRDGDGVNELCMVKLAGPEGSIVLDVQEVDSIPYVAWTPVIMTHKFMGMSVADLVLEIQELRTAVMRGMLDNIYLTNAPTKTIVPELTYMEDVLEGGPGAIWRVKSQDAIQTHVTPFMGEAALGVLAQVDRMREERTGVSGTTQGLNPDALADSTNLIGSQIMSQAQQRVKMVARIFAEVGFKPLILRLHEICSKYETKPRQFEYNGKFVTVNPREWDKRSEFNVHVGVGHADKAERIAGINMILSNQEKIVASGGLGGPLLTKENVHAALVEQAKLAGYADGGKFYRDPSTYQPPPASDPVDEALELERHKQKSKDEKEAVEHLFAEKQHQDEMSLKRKELDMKGEQFDRQLKQQERLHKQEMVLKYGKDFGQIEAQGAASSGASE